MIGLVNPVLAQVRLTEAAYDPEVAARGFTGSAGCSGVSCLELNPAYLQSNNDGVNPHISFGIRFNEALFDSIEDWKHTKEVFESDRYREIFLTTWNLVSWQTAKVDLDIGFELGDFAFSYSPSNFGATFLVHDPVLPFGDLYLYALSSMRAGYAATLPMKLLNLKSFRVGASLKYSSATAKRFTFSQISSQFDESTSADGQWVRGRLGMAAALNTERHIALSMVISGIPIFGNPLPEMPHTDYFDIQPGVSVEFGKFLGGNISGYYSLSRLTRDESIWLKQHGGIEGTIGRFGTSIGVSDAMLTYGLNLVLPFIKFSVATYGVEYSSRAQNMTDRVYWFKIEI